MTYLGCPVPRWDECSRAVKAARWLRYMPICAALFVRDVAYWWPRAVIGGHRFDWQWHWNRWRSIASFRMGDYLTSEEFIERLNA